MELESKLFSMNQKCTKILKLPRHRCRKKCPTRYIWLIDEIEAYSRPI